MIFWAFIFFNFLFLYSTGNRAGGGSDDSWYYREVMSKTWLDFVTQRVVLRRIFGSSGIQRLARWVKPEIDADDTFMINNRGIQPT